MELRGALKVRDANFEPDKLGFVLEARGDVQQQFLERGQSNVQNALRQAEKSAWDLFVSQLEQDQGFFRSHLAYDDGFRTHMSCQD